MNVLVNLTEYRLYRLIYSYLLLGASINPSTTLSLCRLSVSVEPVFNKK